MLLQAKIYFVIIFVFMTDLSEEKYRTEVQQLINAIGTTYCPHTNLCQSNASLPLNDSSVSPCCDDCSCDDDCWKKGNCCPDKHNATNRSPSIECQETLVKGSSNYYDFNAYWVVKKCPETTTNTTLARKCKRKSLRSIDDYIWVSDPASNTIYNNKWCAECHGINETVEWSVGTECIDMLKGDFDFNDETNIDRCNLIVIPPENINVETNGCNKPFISVCNKTGYLRNFNRSIAQACSVLKQPFIVERYVGVIVYRNVFCAMCNEQSYDQYGFDTVCKPRKSFAKAPDSMFVGMINWRFYKEVKNKNNKCVLDEVEDEVVGICRRLTCPMLTAPFYGTCERAVEKTVWLQIEILYRIDPLWETSSLKLSDIENLDMSAFGEKAIKKFERNLGLASKGCVSCSPSIWTSTEVSEASATNRNLTLPAYFVVHMKYITNKNCGEDVISEGLHTLLGTEMQVTMSEGASVKFSTSLDSLSLDNMFMTTRNIFSKIDPPCMSTAIITLSQSKLCPMITLTDEDYAKLMGITSARKQVNELFSIEKSKAFIPDQVSKNVTVCLDDYRAMFKENDVNTAVHFQLAEAYVPTAVLILLSSINN